MKDIHHSPTNPSHWTPPGLLTDLYELTMAAAYLKSGSQEKEAVFHLFFRNHPFQGGYTVAAGLEPVVHFLENLSFCDDDLVYLRSLKGTGEVPLFDPEFLVYLKDFRFACNVDAVPEGTVVFPHQPILRVSGPIMQAQLIETALLNIINFQSLIATKAARICQAAQGDPVIEFGLRRAQGPDGALSATRASFIGGCTSTSNVLAGKLFGIPVKGTHAHSWVMSFEDEWDAFEAYAEAMPHNSVYLVDTYDTLEGVAQAIRIGRKLREEGHDLTGIRLDSGDLAYLSIEARALLDEAGFEKTAIIASSDLDEHLIQELKNQGAKISIWGVGTRLASAYDQPALGGVYKLGAVREPGGDWQPRIKISERSIKTTTPGILQIRRFRQGNMYLGDALYDINTPLPETMCIVDPADSNRRKIIPKSVGGTDLLQPVFRKGQRVYTLPSLRDIQQNTRDELQRFHQGIRRFSNPHEYPAGLELTLHEMKQSLIQREREKKENSIRKDSL